jgi:hypothetical protein
MPQGTTEVPGDTDPTTPPVKPPDAPPPDAPALSTLPARYGYDTVPIRGRAEAFTTVFVEGGRAPVATDADSSGSFCVDVPLAVDESQTLEVFAQDENGKTSDPTQATIEQDPGLAQYETPEQPLVNLAPGLPAYSNESPKEGLCANVTDGDPTSSVVVPMSYLWVDLGELYDLETIEITFPDELDNGNDEFATEYYVLASAEASPVVPPDAWDDSWILVYDVWSESGLEAGDGGADTFVLPTPLRARYVAFYLIENNKTDWFSSESIRVSEIRVDGRSIEALPARPLTPTCANGGVP